MTAKERYDGLSYLSKGEMRRCWGAMAISLLMIGLSAAPADWPWHLMFAGILCISAGRWGHWIAVGESRVPR